MRSSKQFLESVFRSMNEKKLDLLGDLFDENVVFHFPGTPHLEGINRVHRFIQILFRKFPVLTFCVNRMGEDLKLTRNYCPF